MRIFCYLLLLFIIVINLGYPQCAGDVNLDNTVDGADVFIIVNHIFDTDPNDLWAVLYAASQAIQIYNRSPYQSRFSLPSL